MSANPKTKKKARRADGVMSPEDLAQAIAAYKARRAERLAAKAQADQEGDTVPVADPKPAEGVAAVADGDDDTVIAASGQADGDDIADQVQMVKDRRDRRDPPQEVPCRRRRPCCRLHRSCLPYHRLRWYRNRRTFRWRCCRFRRASLRAPRGWC